MHREETSQGSEAYMNMHIEETSQGSEAYLNMHREETSQSGHPTWTCTEKRPAKADSLPEHAQRRDQPKRTSYLNVHREETS